MSISSHGSYTNVFFDFVGDKRPWDRSGYLTSFWEKIFSCQKHAYKHNINSRRAFLELRNPEHCSGQKYCRGSFGFSGEILGFLGVFLKALKNSESRIFPDLSWDSFRVCCASLNLALMSDASSGVSHLRIPLLGKFTFCSMGNVYLLRFAQLKQRLRLFNLLYWAFQ